MGRWVVVVFVFDTVLLLKFALFFSPFAFCLSSDDEESAGWSVASLATGTSVAATLCSMGIGSLAQELLERIALLAEPSQCQFQNRDVNWHAEDS